MLLYAIILFIFYLVLLFLNSYPSSKALILQQITEFCVIQRDYVLFPVDTIPISEKDATSEAVFWAIYLGAIVALIILVTQVWIYCSGPITWFWQKVKNAFTNFCAFLRTTPRRLLTIVGTPIATAYWLSGIATYFWDLQNIRSKLQLSTGSTYQGAEWGFGQVTIVLLWLPSLLDIIFECYGMNFK